MFPQNSRRIIREPARNIDEAEYPELWDGLVGAWSPCLQTHKSDRLYDLSGLGNHGTLTNMDAATDWVTSGGYRALDFDGTNDYVTVSDQSSLWIVGDVSISVWVYVHPYTPTGGSYQFIATKESTSGWAASLPSVYINESDQKLRFNRGNGASSEGGVTSNSTVPTGRWILISGVCNGTTYKIYFDSTLDNSATYAGTIADVGTPLVFAIRNWTSGTGTQWQFQGMVSAFLVHNYSISDNSIRLLYQLGPGGWATPRRKTAYFFTAPPVRPLYTTLKTSLGKNFIFRT